MADITSASSTPQKEYGSLNDAFEPQHSNNIEDVTAGLIKRSTLDYSHESDSNDSFYRIKMIIKIFGGIFVISLSLFLLTRSGKSPLLDNTVENMSSVNGLIKDELIMKTSPHNDLSNMSDDNMDIYLPYASAPKFFKQLLWSRTSKKDHFVGVLEFCSNEDDNTFGYGLAGECIPGQAAPIIRMQPKKNYQLTLVNNGHIDTNLHTHGLHVSGVGSVDDVTRNVEPGMCLVYQYYIPDDADVGTFWYHPHRHPLVTKSAFGGAYGMLIVDETVTDYYPPHLENFLKHNQVLLQFSSMYNKAEKNAVRHNRINGQIHLNLTLTPEVYYYFRVSAVAYAASFNYLEFSPRTSCESRPVAYDGVYRSEIPHPDSMYKHMLTLSSRLDLAVRCTTDAVLHFHQGKASDSSLMVHIFMSNDILGSSESTIGDRIEFSPTLPSSPYWDLEKKTAWKPRRPYYMPDLMSEKAVDDIWPVSMDDYYTDGTKGVSINQVTWDPNNSIRTFNLNQLAEIPVYKTKSHPFHAHINRMQIVQPGGCGERFEEGQYFDTLTSNLDVCTVRIKYFDFAGRIVIHCHRFGHEDKGMMTWIDVLDGPGHGLQGFKEVNCTYGAA